VLGFPAPRLHPRGTGSGLHVSRCFNGGTQKEVKSCICFWCVDLQEFKSESENTTYVLTVFLPSISSWLLSASVVQLGTVTTVFVSANKDTILNGNFL